MEDFFEHSKTKAFVFLLSEGDPDNKMMISEDQIMIIRKGRKKIYVLQDIEKLKIENKKLLLPIIAGGIISPLAVLSYFVNMFHPLLHLISVMAGLFLFYIGWAGKSSLTIKKRSYELNYYLPSISKNLEAFIEYVNALIKYPNNSDQRALLFFDLKKDSNTIIKNSKSENLSLFPILGYTYEQLQEQLEKQNFTKVGAIDPSKAGREIKIVYDPKTNQMRPNLEGPVLAESIVEIIEF